MKNRIISKSFVFNRLKDDLRMLNIDLKLNFDIITHFCVIPYLVFLPRFPNNNYLEAIHYSYNQRIQSTSLCTYFHNVTGKVEHKIKELYYLNIVDNKYNPDFICLCETKTSDTTFCNNISNYHCISINPYKTINNGYINAFILLIKKCNISNINIIKITVFYIVFETINPIVSFIIFYIPPSMVIICDLVLPLVSN